MTFKVYLKLSVMVAATGLMAGAAHAQTAAEPADGLPEVEVIQQKKAAAAAKKKAAPVQAASPAPQAPPPVDVVDEAPALENSPYGASASGPAAARAESGPLPPVNARTILPGDLQNFPGAGTRVTSDELGAQQPLTNHDALARVPGVMTTADDGMGRHSGIGVRGSPMRRSRKVLVLEDGQPINFAPYLDSSTHYTPPTERIESIEVMRGMILNYGPLNNHGVVNFRNLSPFGANETVIKAAIGYTEGSDTDINNYRHVHTRQNLGNVGIVASYSGSEAGGAWDNEELRYNDFYGAIGFRGTNQDLTISGGFFRQRDTYDETNFEGTEEEFFANGRNKAGIDEDVGNLFNLSTYNGDHYRLQAAHNWYINSDTTLSTRVYGADHDRARFYVDDVEDNPPFIMEGRDRQYSNWGVDSRIEFANLPLFGGMTHDLQAGVRYEEQFFTNSNRAGLAGEVLDFDRRGHAVEQVKLNAEAFAAFIQTAIHVTQNLTVTPGVRFESYDVAFRETIEEDDDYLPGIPVTDAERLRSEHDLVLPGIGFAWEAMPRTTLYGSYHQGITPHIIRDANEEGGGFPLKEEEGDNFTIGVRSKAVRGFTFDVAYFHQRIDNYQFKEAFTLDGNQIFTSLDEVTFDGVELGARIESAPFTGGPWNFFGEVVYTYVDGQIEKGLDADADDNLVDVSGNRVPESMEHFANLTLGVAHKAGWDASVTWTYRGDYFTDSINTPLGGDDEGVRGLVPDEWLLSARSNYHVNDDLSLFVSGYNLTDEFYIVDRADGMKPGQGRTIMGGFTYKFD